MVYGFSESEVSEGKVVFQLLLIRRRDLGGTSLYYRSSRHGVSAVKRSVGERQYSLILQMQGMVYVNVFFQHNCFVWLEIVSLLLFSLFIVRHREHGVFKAQAVLSAFPTLLLTNRISICMYVHIYIYI